MNGNDRALSLELDMTTARLLVRLAETWGVSEEEAVRRALEQVDANTHLLSTEARLKAFKNLQGSLDLTPAKAAEWQNAVHESRR